MKNNFLVFLILAIFNTILWLAPASYAVTIDKIVVFGDSLSDTGNILTLTKTAKKAIPLIPLIPKDPHILMADFQMVLFGLSK